MVGPKNQDFWPKNNILKGNHCILRIRGVQVENKVVQKLKLEKNVFDKLALPVFSKYNGFL